ncbi:MAG: aromatic ring-hydroxylating dioxygenase subunit alpha [Candidatus Marinimicrobia bacterium]|jgi:Rieske 2Fe-2S family protein|nr:aromatic ring-hydroxylating dioxygenase subunit alpha [Candidatus Neomarinimicrobiota bacterium]MDP6789530.1 aromatic ring-hydroxylating dioxygenase subunit alpha [Candidatus Neomarinimicrobiota bacterium]MDP7072436.1 aromatic ring-hydroxylating dioxygenase subunit alpha [Candidatus Neomarinimicrobiota bacterium]
MSFKKTAETLEPGAKTLSRKYYTDPIILDQEYENIFQNNWLPVARAADLDEQGTFKTFEIAGESIIVLKDDKNNLRAFYNVCRHRGTRVCVQPEGRFSKSIQCGYHGWTYDLNGNLIGAPHMDAVNDFRKSDYPLHPISVDQWNGFICINLADNPAPLHDIFSSLTERFSQWRIDELEVAEHKMYQVNCNWKVIIQNYCECYHCPIIHPDLTEIHNYMGGRNDMHSGPYLGGYMNFNDNIESITHSGKLSCPPIKGLKEENLARVYYYSIFPNFLISLHPEYVMAHSVWPESVNRSRIDCFWLFSKGIAQSNKYKIEDAINFWKMTNLQDWEICERSQLGIQSKKYKPAPYSGQESLLAAYDKYYLSQLNA